jgi:NADH-quinone oxidoreductase subunit K
MLGLATFFPEMFHAQVLFLIGLFGLGFNSGNVITMLMSLELMLAGASLMFLTSSFLLDDIGGQVFAIFILTVAAAESAIGLAMLVVYYKLTGSISIDKMVLLRG